MHLFSLTDIGRRTVFALILMAAAVLSANAGTPAKTWPNGQLRGLCVGKPRIAMTWEKTFKRLADWKVNVITVNFTYDERLSDLPDVNTMPEVPPEMTAYRGAFDRLDKIIALAKKYGIFVNICLQGAVGSDLKNVATANASLDLKEKAEKVYFANLLKLLKYAGQKYKNEAVVISYNIIPEPHTPWVKKNWQNKIVPEAIKAVRSVDMNTYLIFSPGLWGFPQFDKLKRLFKDPANRISYGFHPYAPHNYTHQGIKKRSKGLKYPGMLKMFDGSPLKLWNKQALFEYMKPAVDFQKKYHVKMFVGEFSVIRWAPGRVQWLEDMCALLDQYKMDWTYHCYTGWNGWNPTFPADAKGSNEPDGGVNTGRLKVLKKYWAKNKVFFKP